MIGLSHPPVMCACGRPLHYHSDEVRARVQALVEQLGADMVVTVAGKSWLVPRHYIALHGLKSWDIERLGFPAVGP